MATTIIASYTVIPIEPTPNGHLWLPDMDQISGIHYTPTIYIYKLAKLENYKEDVIERMRRSLSKILVHYYPIAGRLCRSGGQIELDLNAKGALLLEAETTKTMSDYGDFSPSDSTKDLVPSIDRTQPMEDHPLLVVQLTRFPRSEGLAVGVAFYHVLSDGLGAIRFINSWAKIARGGGEGGGDSTRLEPHEIPFLDRTILKFPNPPPPPRFEHAEFKPLPLILGRSDNTVKRNKKTTAALLRLTAEQVEKLKKKANKNDDDDDDDHEFRLVPKQQGSSRSRPYSRYEAIAAHIWRCASKARELNENQPTVVKYPVEFRNRMIPPLPENYFGNALATTMARDYVGEITSKPLSYVAQKIREASELVTNEYVRSQIDVIRGQKNLDDATALFLGIAEEGNNNNNNNIAPFFGNPNLQLISWMNMPVYEADFGWGKPMHFGIADLWPFDGGLILLSPDGDGSVIVSMHFQIAHMQLFNKFFYGDI